MASNNGMTISEFREENPNISIPFEYGSSAKSGLTSYNLASVSSNKDRMKNQNAELLLARARISASAVWREPFETDWNLFIDAYAGMSQCGPIKSDGQHEVVVNMIKSTIDTVLPTVTRGYPDFTVNTKVPGQEANARNAECLLDYAMRTHSFAKPVRKALWDWAVIGHAWVKLRWDSLYEDVELDEEEALLERERQVIVRDYAAKMMGQEFREGDVEVPSVAERLIYQRPVLEYVSPFNMFVDSSALDFESCRWIAHRYLVPIELVKNNDEYIAATRSQVEADTYAITHASQYDEESAQAAELNKDLVTVIEYYDLVKREFMVFTEREMWTDDKTPRFLVRPKKLPYGRAPFEYVSNQELPNRFYPMGEVEGILEQQYELNYFRSKAAIATNRFARKVLVREDVISEEALQAISSDEDGSIIPVDTSEDLNDVVVPLNFPAVDTALFAQANQIMEDIILMSGVSQDQRGLVPEIRRSATEIAEVSAGQSAKSTFRQDKVDDFWRGIGRQTLQQYQTFAEGELLVRVTGYSQAQEFIQFTRSDITGEFDFNVVAGSTKPRDDIFRRNEVQQILQLKNQFPPDMFDDRALWVEMSRRLGFPSMERVLAPEAPPAPEGLPAGPPQTPSLPAGPPQAPAQPTVTPDGRTLASKEQVLQILADLQSGEITPDEVPPELLQQIAVLQQLQGGEGLPEVGFPSNTPRNLPNGVAAQLDGQVGTQFGA